MSRIVVAGLLNGLVCLSQGLVLVAEEEVPKVAWQPQQSGTQASLRGLSVVNDKIAWTSGAGGLVLRTVDGGEHWTRAKVPGASELDFRDVQAFDDKRAIVMSAGSPGLILETGDGGTSWQVRFEDRRPEIFLNALGFWSEREGMAFGDPIEGRLVMIRTADGGQTWRAAQDQKTVTSLTGEAGFAASGTCLATLPSGLTCVGLGGATSQGKARILRSTDRGQTWSAMESPLPCTASRGIFSLLLLDDRDGMAVGGDYRTPEDSADLVALTADGGQSWRIPAGNGPRGFRSCAAACRKLRPPIVIAVGPNGSDMSRDLGHHWEAAGDEGYHTVAFAPDSGMGWAVGADGRIARISVESFEPAPR